jgi:type I phosphodiesterase/nucleotide pyrophosphatase
MTTRFLKAGLVSFLAATLFVAFPAADDDGALPVSHVLLISVDGLHASDLAWYTATHPNSALAQLRQHGRTYTNATSSKPSDSFPGLLAMVTGGTPRSTGVYYDDSWDRLLSGDISKPCTFGAEVTWKQNLDVAYPPFATFADYAAYWATHAGALDENKLPRDPSRGCVAPPVFPHQFPRINNVFEVIKAAGGRTAWTDKHPAYEFLNGPSGIGMDDSYNPEIATPIAGITITNSFALTMKYDNLKVEAVKNQIRGYNHSGTNHVGTPTLFGMNFQAVSVGQKLRIETFPGEPVLAGGYTANPDGTFTPSSGLLATLDNTDAGIGAMVSTLQSEGLAASTLIIISAKHGNSPIDPAALVRVSVATIQNIVNSVGPGLLAQVSADTGPLIWLTPAGQAQASQIVAAFNTSIVSGGNPAHLVSVLSGSELTQMFADPLSDNRAPDIILMPIPGTVYTTSGSKIADHGSFYDDDVHVALLVANPNLPVKTIDDSVETRQIACTILEGLSIECAHLQSEQSEPSKFLPHSNHKNNDSEIALSHHRRPTK